MQGHYFRVVMDCRTNTFTLCGELDMSSSAALRTTLAAVRSPSIVLDLSELTFIDSSGLACLAATAQQHPRVVLRGLRPQHDRLLDITRLRKEFEIEEAPAGR
jgi:anti-anti-sigma factor